VGLALEITLMTDAVEKVDFFKWTNFPETLVRSFENYLGHVSSPSSNRQVS